MRPDSAADLLLLNGRFRTLDRRISRKPVAEAVAIRSGKFLEVGDIDAVMRHQWQGSVVIDLGGRTVIPGLNDSHLHLIRNGLNYNLELRWEGIPSLTEALRMLKLQAERTPSPQWVHVVGGWSEFQFAERRRPTLGEINAAAPDTPVFLLHFYGRALLNRAALRAIGYTRDTPNPPGGELQKDKDGTPAGMLMTRSNAMLLSATLARSAALPREYQVNSTRQFMRELNRLGITSVIEPGSLQNYPQDYEVVEQLARESQLTVRIAYNLYSHHKGKELEDFKKWTGMVSPGQGNDYYRHNGAGEMLAFSSVECDDFFEPHAELPMGMEAELEQVVRYFVTNRWPFRVSATHDESISRMLNVFEKVNRDIRFGELHWLLDRAETISERNIERVRNLGGGIAIQHRIAFQREHSVQRYGAEPTRQTPPVARMLEMGVPVGGGADVTRVASYNPWTAIYSLVSGHTVGGTRLHRAADCISRDAALQLWTVGNAWFSNEQGKKGRIVRGQLADLAVLSNDYFTVPENEIKGLESVMTIVGGKIVHGAAEFSAYAPPALPVLSEWSPVTRSPGHCRPVRGDSHVSMPHSYA